MDYAFHEKYPALTHRHAGLLESPQKTFWRAFNVVKKLGWTLVDFSEKDLRIEATDKSFWFGRTSDIVQAVEAHRSAADATGTDKGEDTPYGRGRVRHIDLA